MNGKPYLPKCRYREKDDFGEAPAFIIHEIEQLDQTYCFLAVAEINLQSPRRIADLKNGRRQIQGKVPSRISESFSGMVHGGAESMQIDAAFP